MSSPTLPRYRINTKTEVRGVIYEAGSEVELPDTVEPRNAWTALNEQAVACFKKRDDAALDAAKKDGADDKELGVLKKKLGERLVKDMTPEQMKASAKAESDSKAAAAKAEADAKAAAAKSAESKI